MYPSSLNVLHWEVALRNGRSPGATCYSTRLAIADASVTYQVSFAILYAGGSRAYVRQAAGQALDDPGGEAKTTSMWIHRGHGLEDWLVSRPYSLDGICGLTLKI